MSKAFYRQRQITDIFAINLNKVVLCAKVSCNNGEDWHYIIGYQVDGETIMPVKTPKNIFSYGVSQYDKKSFYTMSFNISETPEWCFSIETFGMRLSHSCLKNWQEDQ